MRFLRIIRRGRWQKRPEPDWPKDSGLPSDALGDMQTSRCRLSVYAVTDAIGGRRVAAAMAATREWISNVEYAVFEDFELESLGISVQHTLGDTPDDGVNGLHYDLGNLTANRLSQLAEIISTGEIRRMTWSDVRALLADEIRAGLVDAARVRPKIA